MFLSDSSFARARARACRTLALPIGGAATVTLLAGCGGSSGITPAANVAQPTRAVSTAFVSLSGTEQTIRGFGGASVWQGAYTDNEANGIFSNGNGSQLGCSIDRVRIDPGGSANWGTELSNAQKAKARGAIIMATPWTPPASMKSNNNVVGGSLNTSQYGAYATYLKSFVTYMSNGGASLYGISMQNEPDAVVSYESCTWTGAQMQSWIDGNGASLGTTLIMPESEGFNHAYSDPSLNDSTAASRIGIIGGHLYGTSPSKYTLAISKGKDVWMTEHYISGQNLTSALALAKEIHDCMTVANYNAYVWWYMKDDNIGFINSSDTITKNGYVMGQFAKFVRPGYVRKDATYNPDASVYVSAYQGSKVIIIAINMGTSAVSQPFSISGGTVTSLTPYITSSSLSLAQQSAVAVSGGNFTYTLPAQSIMTFTN